MKFRRNAFAIEVADYQSLPIGRDQRYGQAVFNVMKEWHFPVAEKLVGTEFDCSNNDENVPKFIDECERLIEAEKEDTNGGDPKTPNVEHQFRRVSGVN